MRRVSVEQSYPKIAVDFLDLAQYRDQRRAPRRIDWLARSGFFAPQIHSVIGGVLTDQIDLAHASCDQPANFSQHRFPCSAAMFPTHLRNNAEATRMITTFG